KVYDIVEEIMEAALEMIETCTCAHGCPSCVGSPIPPFSQLDPEGGGKGMIPDKEAALVILHAFLEKDPYIPPPPDERSREEFELMDRPKGKPLPVELEAKLKKSLRKRNR
ncbi:MAG: DUF1998 domain-containing protein, partial [Candidatus Krumholzibacteria bacterium]|nr:DUF1998 domain-containing protein [Candidatus Krumholzibacteria bacterium]